MDVRKIKKEKKRSKAISKVKREGMASKDTRRKVSEFSKKLGKLLPLYQAIKATDVPRATKEGVGALREHRAAKKRGPK